MATVFSIAGHGRCGKRAVPQGVSRNVGKYAAHHMRRYYRVTPS